jgi:hypothetical protein
VLQKLHLLSIFWILDLCMKCGFLRCFLSPSNIFLCVSSFNFKLKLFHQVRVKYYSLFYWTVIDNQKTSFAISHCMCICKRQIKWHNTLNKTHFIDVR